MKTSLDFVPYPDALESGLLQFVAEMLWLLKPKVIVEAGTYRGHFAAVASASCPSAIVWTADPNTFELHEAAHAPNVKHFRGDFDHMLDQHVGLQSVDIAMIDSGPAEGTTVDDLDMRWRHFNSVKAYMKHGGLILIDDTDGNWNHVDDIKTQGVTFYGKRGLTVVQV